MNSIESISQFITQGAFSAWVAMALAGLLFAVNPCPLATHISAILYFRSESHKPRDFVAYSLYYLLGRWFSYLVLWMVAMLLIGSSMRAFHWQEKILSYGEHLIGPLLMIFGALLLWGSRLPFLHIHMHLSDHSRVGKMRQGRLRSFLIGTLLALGFCPVTALLFFGWMIPITQESIYGFPLFFLFSLLALSPAILLMFLILWGMKRVDQFQESVAKMQKKIHTISSLLIFLLGLFVTCSHFLLHGH